MQNVLAIISTADACAWYRIQSPFNELKARGYACEYTTWDRFQPKDLERFDVLVTPRLKPGDVAMVQALASHCVIYEVDDDFTHTTQISPLLEELWRVCKAITVTTPALAAVMRAYNAQVHVLPNCLDFTIWDQPITRRDPRLTIGLTGGSNHYEDWQVVAPALKHICSEHPEVAVAFAAFYPDYLAEAVPQSQTIVFPWAPYAQLPMIVGSFDIGLAPLANTPFNCSKSPVKVLEYMARGIPWVASAVGPYQAMPAGAAGFLAASADEFYAHLKRLVLDAGQRRMLGEHGRQWVRTNHDIRANASLWWQTYQTVWQANSLAGCTAHN